MDKVTITVHGGRKCRNCKWLLDGGYGSDDFYMDQYADRAVVALDEHGHVAGVWKYDKSYHKAVRSSGTWVAPKYRKQGLALKLWEVGLAHDKPERVKVLVTTDRGYTLACSLEKLFPDITWVIEDRGSRELRKLKKTEVQ
jgi:GNAT superfamily N-acetyltransferase